MTQIRPPKNPSATDDVIGPNWPGTVDPGFGNPSRDTTGDTVGAGDYAGRRRAPSRDEWGWPVGR